MRFLIFDSVLLGAIEGSIGSLWLDDDGVWSSPTSEFAREVLSDERAIELDDAEVDAELIKRSAPIPRFRGI